MKEEANFQLCARTSYQAQMLHFWEFYEKTSLG